MVEDRAQRRSGILHLADVVHAHIPLVAGAMEGMGESPRHVVPLQNQHALATVLREQRRGGQSADAGADNDRVPLVGDRILLVRTPYGRYLPWSSPPCPCVPRMWTLATFCLRNVARVNIFLL